MPISRRSDPYALLPESLRALAEHGDLRRYRKGTLLIQEGDAGDTLFIILAGSLRAYSVGDRNREITYGTYGPGEYLGEMSLDGGLRSASVITLEASECSVVTRHLLEAHIARHPAFAFELMAKLIRRARAATLSAKQLALNDVYGRLVLLLDALAQTSADGVSAGGASADGPRIVAARLTHREMANRLGCSREMVSRLMKDLEAGGYVAAEGAGWTVARTLPGRW